MSQVRMTQLGQWISRISKLNDQKTVTSLPRQKIDEREPGGLLLSNQGLLKSQETPLETCESTTCNSLIVLRFLLTVNMNERSYSGVHPSEHSLIRLLWMTVATAPNLTEPQPGGRTSGTLCKDHLLNLNDPQTWRYNYSTQVFTPNFNLLIS